MEVAVIGPGALGCLFGGRLAADGHDVTLVHHRESSAEAVRAGVRVESEVPDLPSIQRRMPVTTDAASIGPVEAVLVFVKAHVTEAALVQHEGCIGPETTVLSLQNGLRHFDRLREHVGEERALAGTTYQGGVLEEPGHVVQTASGPSRFGGVDREAAEQLASVFEAAALPASVVEDPEPLIWEKQLVSIGIKPLAALTRLTNDRLVATADRRDLMGQLVDEAVAVAAARGIDLSNRDHAARVIDICRDTDHRSSALQDVLAGRETEIDEINGALVEMAEMEGIDVPANRLTTTLVRGLEASYR